MNTENVVCIANISPRERQKRLVIGMIMFAGSVIVLAALLAIGAERWWRLILFPALYVAATGFFQWREKT